MSTRAILFDFDGVLADTENVHVAAWEQVFALMGWDAPPEVCAEAAEVDDRVFLAGQFERRSIRDGDVLGWVRRKQDVTRQMLADWPRLYPGVAEVIGRLGRRASPPRLAVVSGTWRENVEATLATAGLLDAFAVIVAKEDVVESKPDPSGYRLAVERLAIAANEAIALEDSPTGLAAARGAGVRVVAIGHRRPAGDWAGDAVYLADFLDAAAVDRALGLAD